MFNHRGYIAIFALGLGVGCVPQPPELTGPTQIDRRNVILTVFKDLGYPTPAWANDIDALMLSHVNASEPGCAVGIARGGEIVYLKGYGKAWLGGSDWSIATLGSVGSVSKTITATALMRMRELGLLPNSLTTRVGQVIQTGNADLSEVLIRDLLSHQAGVPGGPTWESGSPPDACNGACSEAVSSDIARPYQAFQWFDAEVEIHPPGGLIPIGAYSNLGYSILGALIDYKATSVGYEEWIWTNLGYYTGNPVDRRNFTTLALAHSWRQDDVPYFARGYRPNGSGSWEAFESWDAVNEEGWEGPSGGWVMTIGDLVRFAIGINTGEIISTASRDAMRLSYGNVEGLGSYGLGVIPATGYYWHGGNIGGHSAGWAWWDDYGGRSLGVAIMCNRGGLNAHGLLPAIANATGLAPGSIHQQGTQPSLGPDGRARPGSYALDLSAVWHDDPHVVLALEFTGAPMLRISHATDGTSLSLYQSATSSSPGGYTLLGRLARTDGYLQTAPRDVTLHTHLGSIEVEHLVLDGVFVEHGEAIADLSLKGRIDMRQLSPYVSCTHIARAGGQCESCDDGARECFQVYYRGLTGQHIAD